MRAFDFTPKNVAEELRILNDPLYQQAQPQVVELMRRLQRARHPADYFELQGELISRTRAQQETSREIRDARRAVGEEVRNAAHEEPKPVERLAELQNQLDLRAHQRRVSEALRFTLLSIGDGMAWKDDGPALGWVGFHTFRHTCASMLFEGGKSIRQVAAWLGHADPSFTLRTYVHLLDDGLGSAEFLDDAVRVSPHRRHRLCAKHEPNHAVAPRSTYAAG